MTATSATARREVEMWRPPVTVAAAVVLAVAALFQHEATGGAVIAAGLVAVLVVLAGIDLASRILPNRIVLPATVAALSANIAVEPDRWAEWLFAAIGAAALLALPLVVVREGVGMGDIKMALLLGAGLGAAVMDALFWGACAAAAMALVLLVRHGSSARRMTFAFGPFLALGGVIAVFTGHNIG